MKNLLNSDELKDYGYDIGTRIKQIELKGNIWIHDIYCELKKYDYFNFIYNNSRCPYDRVFVPNYMDNTPPIKPTHFAGTFFVYTSAEYEAEAIKYLLNMAKLSCERDIVALENHLSVKKQLLLSYEKEIKIR